MAQPTQFNNVQVSGHKRSILDILVVPPIMECIPCTLNILKRLVTVPPVFTTEKSISKCTESQVI